MNPRTNRKPETPVRQNLFGRNVRVVDVVDRRWSARIGRLVPTRQSVGVAFSFITLILVIVVFGATMFGVAYLFKSGLWWRTW